MLPSQTVSTSGRFHLKSRYNKHVHVRTMAHTHTHTSMYMYIAYSCSCTYFVQIVGWVVWLNVNSTSIILNRFKQLNKQRTINQINKHPPPPQLLTFPPLLLASARQRYALRQVGSTLMVAVKQRAALLRLPLCSMWMRPAQTWGEGSVRSSLMAASKSASASS